MRGLRRAALSVAAARAVWGEYAARGRRSQTGVLIALAGLLLALSTACGGGDAPEATEAMGTPAGERQERERQAAAVEQAETQTGAQTGAQEVEGEQAEATAESVQVESEAVAQEAEAQTESQAAEGAKAVDAEFEDESEETITFEGALVERIAAALAEHRAGLAVERNVLGDADAPVLIVEYGDFQ